MTDIALRAESAPELPRSVALDPTGGRLVAWAAGLEAAHRIGSALCRTSFVPKHFAGKPEDAAAAILFGDEIGLTPTQALRSIHVISGTPGLYARTMVALVQSKGHEVWTEVDTPAKVAVCGRRRGSSNVERSEWTAERARRAGYTSNKKYETDPQAMLYARAASDVCRKVAADALAGLAYTIEEMELSDAPPTVTVTRADAEPKRTARRAPTKPPTAPEPELDQGESPEAEPAQEASEAATRPQVTKLNIQLKEMGLDDRDAKLSYLSRYFDREIASSSDLTKTEASRLIEELQADAATESEPPGWEPEP